MAREAAHVAERDVQRGRGSARAGRAPAGVAQGQEGAGVNPSRVLLLTLSERTSAKGTRHMSGWLGKPRWWPSGPRSPTGTATRSGRCSCRRRSPGRRIPRPPRPTGPGSAPRPSPGAAPPGTAPRSPVGTRRLGEGPGESTAGPPSAPTGPWRPTTGRFPRTPSTTWAGDERKVARATIDADPMRAGRRSRLTQPFAVGPPAGRFVGSRPPLQRCDSSRPRRQGEPPSNAPTL